MIVFGHANRMKVTPDASGAGDSRSVRRVCHDRAIMRTYVRSSGTRSVHRIVDVWSGRRGWLTEPVPKRHNEVRDPVHVFIEFDQAERAVIDSRPFQRLRDIHQLALSYLVYPGASHKRFEHSLGVMEVAGRIFDVVTRPDKVNDAVRDVIPEHGGPEHQYWRTVLRIAALCHDLGHLPFSHAAEEALLPDGWDHERLSREIIHSPEMAAVWESMPRPKPEPDDIVMLALGPRKVEKLGLGLSFDPWQAILAEIIVGDVFGADRIDYLLRDSLHTGVAYGRFDHNRLIGTLRIIPGAPEGGDGSIDADPQLGCERGGLESAEGLMLARYFMFAQVYYHSARLAYNEHLKDFLTAWLPEGKFTTDIDGHLAVSDSEVLAAIRAAAADPSADGHDPARRITGREHFRIAYSRRPDDVGARSLATAAIARAAAMEFGAENIRYGTSPRRGEPPDFPVLDRDGSSVSSLSLSEVLTKLPASRDEYVFVEPTLRHRVKAWIGEHRADIIDQAMAEQAREEEVN
jgi:HD superfamily phosphohydrolase